MKTLFSSFRRRPEKAEKRARTPLKVRLPAATPLPLPPVIARTLRQVRFRHFWVSLAECAAVVLAVLPALWLFQAAADWWFDLPWGARLILLLADLGVVGLLIFRFGIRPLRQSLTPERTALKIEKAIPEFRSALISAVELSAGQPGSAQGSLALVRELLARAAAQVRALNPARRVIPTRSLREWLKWTGLALLLAGGSAALFWPKSGVLIERLFLSRAPLPTRTQVIPVSGHQSAVVGGEITLSARAEGVIPRSGIVRVVYANGERQEITVNASSEDPAFFQVTMPNIQQSFRYRFGLNDGTGPEFSVTAQIAPVLETVQSTQAYPGYTRLPETKMPMDNLALLAGSRVRLEGRATQPLKRAEIRLEGVNESVEAEVGRPDAASFRGEFTVPREGLTGLSVSLTNAEGVVSREDTVYRVELLSDQAPAVEWLAPAADRLSVLLSSKPSLRFTVRDDYAVQKLALKYEISLPLAPGKEEPEVTTGEIALKQNGDQAEQVFEWDLAASQPPLVEGSTVSYWIEAADNNDATGPGLGQTSRKTLAIVTPAEKRAELLEILGARAAEIEQISETQRKVNESLDGTIRQAKP